MGKKAVRTRFNRNILDRELAIFLAVGYAIGRDEFYVHLELLPRIRRAFIRLVLGGYASFFGGASVSRLFT